MCLGKQRPREERKISLRLNKGQIDGNSCIKKHKNLWIHNFITKHNHHAKTNLSHRDG